jgi:hypothetical protein
MQKCPCWYCELLQAAESEQVEEVEPEQVEEVEPEQVEGIVVLEVANQAAEFAG